MYWKSDYDCRLSAKCTGWTKGTAETPLRSVGSHPSWIDASPTADRPEGKAVQSGAKNPTWNFHENFPNGWVGGGTGNLGVHLMNCRVIPLDHCQRGPSLGAKLFRTPEKQSYCGPPSLRPGPRWARRRHLCMQKLGTSHKNVVLPDRSNRREGHR